MDKNRIYEEVIKNSKLYVDFNELIEEDLVLLSKEDYKNDNNGNKVPLFEGKPVSIYMDDEDENNEQNNLIADGIVEKNNSPIFPNVKWNCRINRNGIRFENDEIKDILNSKNEELIIPKLLEVIYYHSNWKFIQDLCLNLTNNENTNISGLAITCLGHIARIHGKIEKEKVIRVLENIENTNLKGKISDAIDDIIIFAK